MLLDDVRTELRVRHYSRRTEESYLAWLLYGSGLRLMECMTMPVKDVDFTCTRYGFATGRANGIGSRCFRRLSRNRFVSICTRSRRCTSET